MFGRWTILFSSSFWTVGSSITCKIEFATRVSIIVIYVLQSLTSRFVKIGDLLDLIWGVNNPYLNTSLIFQFYNFFGNLINLRKLWISGVWLIYISGQACRGRHLLLSSGCAISAGQRPSSEAKIMSANHRNTWGGYSWSGTMKIAPIFCFHCLCNYGSGMAREWLIIVSAVRQWYNDYAVID